MPNWRKGVQGPQRKYVPKKRRKTAAKKRTSQLKKNTKDIKILKSVGFQYAPFHLKESGVLTSYLHSSLISTPINWSGIYRMHGVSDSDLPRQYHLKSVGVSWLAQCESADVGNLWVQVMIVSLKRKMAAQVIQRTTRLTNFTENLDYAAVDAGTTFALQGDCMYKLNPDLYTTHYNSGQRRIGEATMAIPATEVTNINNGTTRGFCTVKFPRKFKNDETSSSGFKELNYAKIEPRQHLYCLVFSNASGSVVTGGELFFSARYQFNGHCNNPN